MPQTSKIISAIIITAIVAGGGVYLWQQQSDIADVSESELDTDTKVWDGDGFSFTYPKELVANEEGLWTEDSYERFLNPPEGCPICKIPFIIVTSETTDLTLDEYIIEDFSLPGNTLDEVLQETNIYHFELNIGDNDFTKITVSDMFDETAYYVKQGDLIVSFRVLSVFWNVNNTEELVEIMSTLKFE